MKYAEALYNKGLISYPRTETDQFPAGFDFHTLIQQQVNDQRWGNYANDLLNAGGFQHPKAGKNNDQSHPPIHPTKFAGHDLNGPEARVYELVVRHYLAVCSQDAHGEETTAHFLCPGSGEEFSATGLIITAHNFLEIYPYIKWADKDLPLFKEGEKITPFSVDLSQGTTSPPPLLTEADLIKLMDQNGIGTDATIAKHIKTIIKRDYVKQKGQLGEFEPTQLGEALVAGYNFIGYRKLNQPELRSKLEQEMKLIGSGQRTKAQVLASGIQEFRAIFADVLSHADKLDKALSRYFTDSMSAGAAVNNTPNFTSCGGCGGGLALRENQMGDSNLVCDTCTLTLRLPRGKFAPKNDLCPLCGFGVIEVTSTQNKTYTVCAKCYSNPPAGQVDDIESAAASMGKTMPCFMCTADCQNAGRRGGGKVRSCPLCASDMELKKTKTGSYFVGCTGFANGCKKALWLPWDPIEMESYKVTTHACPTCPNGLMMLKLTHSQRAVMQDGLPASVDVCVGGCQHDFREKLMSSNRNFLTWETDAPPGVPAVAPKAAPKAPSRANLSASTRPYQNSNSRTYPAQSNFNNGNDFDMMDTDDPPPRRFDTNKSFSSGRSYGSNDTTSVQSAPGGSRLGEPPVMSGGVPLCFCATPLVTLTTKSGHNQGRKFWKCPQQCEIFIWEGEEDQPLKIFQKKGDSNRGGYQSNRGGYQNNGFGRGSGGSGGSGYQNKGKRGSSGGFKKTGYKKSGRGGGRGGGGSGGGGWKKRKRGGGDDDGGGYDYGGYDDE
jgi:ssDNA-binding Zn-finger/Zn-ribbon topoisomerase 1